MATTRNNYGTFVPVEAVDWGKAIGGLYNTIDKIGLDREQQRQELDKLMTDSISAINNSELFKTQSLQDYVLAGAENGRNVINDANKRLKAGQIKPAEYRSIINNVNSYWSSMSNSMKNFDSVNQELLQRQQPGEDGSAPAGSEFEEFLLQKHASLSDLRNSNYMFSPDSGEGYMVKIDPVTGQTKKVMNSLSIADKSNIMDQRYDFEKEIVTATRGMKQAYTMEDGTVTIKDPMKNPAVANSVAALITGMTNNPRTTAQALARYGGYQFYEDDEDMNQIIQEAINDEAQSRRILGKSALTQSEIENITKNVSNRLIKVSIDLNNRYQPQISPEQQKDAEAILEDLIVAQFPLSRTENNTRTRSSSRGTGSGSTDTVDKKAMSLVTKVRDALSVSSGATAAKNINDLLPGGNERVAWTGKNFAIERYFPNDKPKDARGKDVRGSKPGIWKIVTPDLKWQTSDFADVFGYGSGTMNTKWIEAIESIGAK